MERDQGTESDVVGQAVMSLGLAPVIVMDLAGNVQGLNDAAAALLRVEASTLVGQELAASLIPAEKRQAHRLALEEYRLSGSSNMLGRPLRLTFLRGDGQALLLDTSIVAVGTGDDVALVAMLHDPSERARPLPGLVEPERALAFAEAIAGIGSIEFEVESGQVAWSDGLYQVLGADRQTLPLSLADTIAQYVHPEDRARAGGSCDGSRRSGPTAFASVCGSSGPTVSSARSSSTGSGSSTCHVSRSASSPRSAT
jgi:PAS domain S-box-containing protein